MQKRSRWMILGIVTVFLFGFSGNTVLGQEIKISYSDWQLAQDIWGKSLREATGDFERLNRGSRWRLNRWRWANGMSSLRRRSGQAQDPMSSPST